jgi:hypothetical protein
MAARFSYYEVLGVAPDAGPHEILDGFLRRVHQAEARSWRGWIARALGIDRGLLEQAKDTLLDPALRSEHDRELMRALPLCPPP